MNLSFNFTECKARPNRRRRVYRRRVATAAKTKTLIAALRQTEFLTPQQADVLLALLGVAQ